MLETLDRQQGVPLKIVVPGWQYRAQLDHGAPGPENYWFKKRQGVVRLIRRAMLRGLIRPQQGWTFAELGCGEGTDLFLIQQVVGNMPGASYVGIDGDPDAVETCRQKADYYEVRNARFLNRDLRYPVPLEDESADVVYCSEVFEHMPSPRELIHEIVRILKPGGLFLLTTPNEPHFLQRSFWSSKRRIALRKAILKADPVFTVLGENGETLPFYGHISTRTTREWDRLLQNQDLSLVDCERGALCYSAGAGDLAMGLQLLAEAFISLLPPRLSRHFSSQVIGLYRKL